MASLGWRRDGAFSPVALGAVVLASSLALTGCGSGGGAKDVGGGVGSIDTAAPAPETGAPSVQQVAPMVDGDCPYLPKAQVAALNGEIVVRIRLDTRIDPPACFFYANESEVQVSTVLYTLPSAKQATEVVNQVVPVASSDRADVAGGWTGGKMAGNDTTGAMLAVAKDNKVLIVHSDQVQTIKVQRIAEAAVPALGG